MKRVLVTGATGFVGRHLCGLLRSHGFNVLGAARSAPEDNFGHPVVVVGDIGDAVDWGAALDGVDAVVHLAARVHVMKETESDPLAEFRRVNVEGTRQLLDSDRMSSVERFVYLSTIKVHGESSVGQRMHIEDQPDPVDPYAASKLEAEDLIAAKARERGFEYTIIRPPLVYGPGVGGNFLRLMKLVDSGVPLPLGSVRNSRSLVGVSNLCDLIRECLLNPNAAGKTYLVSDDEDVSTGDLVREMAAALSRKPRLMPVSPAILLALAKLAGRSAEVSRLVDSLRVDVSPTLEDLGWKPPISLREGIESAVTWYKGQQDNAGH